MRKRAAGFASRRRIHFDRVGAVGRAQIACDRPAARTADDAVDDRIIQVTVRWRVGCQAVAGAVGVAVQIDFRSIGGPACRIAIDAVRGNLVPVRAAVDQFDAVQRVVGDGVAGHVIGVGALPEINSGLVRFGGRRRTWRNDAQRLFGDAEQVVEYRVAAGAAAQHLDAIVVAADDIAADRVVGRLQLDAYAIAVRCGFEAVQSDDVVDDEVAVRSAARRNGDAAAGVARRRCT